MFQKNPKLAWLTIGLMIACAPTEQRSDLGEDANRQKFSCEPEALSRLPLTAVFDGTDEALQSNWHSWQKQKVSENWSVNTGVLTLKAGVKFDELVLNGSYDQFILAFTWAVSSGGNSGVKYNVKEASGQPIGFEYQIIDDDIHPDAALGINGNRKTAALYDLLPRAPTAILNPAHAYNDGCIAVSNGVVEHWLNGRQILRIALDSDELKERIESSKFRNVQDYSEIVPAQILLQDHGDAVWFKRVGMFAIPAD